MDVGRWLRLVRRNYRAVRAEHVSATRSWCLAVAVQRANRWEAAPLSDRMLARQRHGMD